MRPIWLAGALVCVSCGGLGLLADGGIETREDGDSGIATDAAVVWPMDAGMADAGMPPRPPDPFADTVVSFMPGLGAGFGQDRFPDIVLGPPHGGGANSGSLDVLSLGKEGVIVLAFTDVIAIDGPGVDLLVFENPFAGFTETGVVSVSDDGVTWHEFPCDAADGGTRGCAGVTPVYSSPENGISPTDPTVAGGDGFDLSEVGLRAARFVRVKDSGFNRFYAPPGGGFDLDAVAVVHGQLVDGGAFP